MYCCFTLGFPRSREVGFQWSTPFVNRTAYAKEQEFSLDLRSLAKTQDSVERVLLKTFVSMYRGVCGRIGKECCSVTDTE